MDFKLSLEIKKLEQTITHKSKLLLIGSCFAENISEYFINNRFETLVNPAGISFNPISLANTLQNGLDNTEITPTELFLSAGAYHNWHYNYLFSNSDKNIALEKMNSSIKSLHHFISEANCIIITFGSAHAYFHKQSGQYVANCHKVPQAEFEKHLLNTEKITKEWQQLIQKINLVNPLVKFIFTVSPVRYVRDGLVENNRSKANLISAVHELCYQNKNCFYFPAYEIVMDELRDYRFFTEDMVHPNKQAIQYVWERFSAYAFDEITSKLNTKITELNKLLNHKTLVETNDSKAIQEKLIMSKEEEIKLLLR